MVEALGQYIRRFREERNQSLRELARKIGCSAAFLSDIELGRRNPSDKVLRDIAHELGISLEELNNHDTRPPVEDIKRAVERDPRYALAFRTLTRVHPDNLLEFAKKEKTRKYKK